MKSQVPMIRQIAWTALLVQLLLLAVLYFIFDGLKIGDPFLLMAFAYGVLAFTLRRTIATEHRKGISLIRAHQYEAARPHFENSLSFFEKNSWVDRYRYLTMLSASGPSYREMALCNIAFIYSQTGRGDLALSYYEKTLEINPQNGLARAGVNMLTSLRT